MKKFLIGLAVVIGVLVIFSVYITRDGSLVTPDGEGTITIGAKTFEAFPLPDYAKPFVTEDYKSYLIEVEPGIKIHILEVGEGYPIYAQHGNPTSGFLYRKIARELPKDRVRLIMPTLVGLGFSSKVPASWHTLDNHMRWMNEALNQLELDGVVYVGQDWGGPVGMGVMALSPGRLKGMVAMNTFFGAPREATELSPAHTFVQTPVLPDILLGVFVNMFDGIQNTQGDPASMPQEIRDLYHRSMAEGGNEKAPLAMMRMVPSGPEHPSAEQLRFMEPYARSLDVPIELVWGTKDPILGKGLPLMQQMFPNAPATETEAGHFLQEEVPDVIAAALMRVVDQVEAMESDKIAAR